MYDTERNMSAAVSCSLDCVSSSTKLATPSVSVGLRRRLSQRLARNRLLNGGDYDTPSVTIHPDDRGSNGLIGLDSPPPIVSVEFLDGHQTVVSADTRGKICVHRLPSGSSSQDSSRSKSTDTAAACKVLELPPLQEQQVMLVKLFPLSDGNSFCVGLPNGDFRVYSPNELRAGEGITLPAISKSNPLKYHGSQIRGARRRYHREFLTGRTLWDQWSDQQQQHDSSSTYFPSQMSLSEISDWDSTRAACLSRPKSYQWLEQSDYLPGRYPSVHDDARWAFYETPSTVLAAFIDPERDCFTMMDHRQGGRPVVHCTAPSSLRVGAGQDDITATCFLSDQALVTAHVWRATSTNATLNNVIKLWDIRHMSEPVSLVDVISPSFPVNRSCKAEPTSEWTIHERDDALAMISPVNNKVPTDATSNFCKTNHQQYITRLDPSGGTTNLMITLQQTDGKRRSNKFVLYNVLRNTICSQLECPESATAGTLPAFAINHRQPTDDDETCLLATCETVAGGATQLSLFDLSKTNENNSTKNQTASDNVTRKRPWNHTTSNYKSSSAKASTSSSIGSIRPTVEDRFGIRTRIASLTWNATGTALAAGSLDGDIFIWNGAGTDDDDTDNNTF